MEHNIIKEPRISAEIYKLTEARLRYIQILQSKIDELEVKYNELTEEDEKSALLLNFFNGDSEMYNLSQLDTSKVPASVIGCNCIFLSDAINIAFASMRDVDTVSVLNSLICNFDFNENDDNGVTHNHLLDARIYGDSAAKVKKLFNITDWYCVSNNFRQAIKEGNFDRIRCGLTDLYIYDKI